jgi:alkanesulfonate monooxygenase SsuD/methylene tetrahydromethanopterin reductase-like flavin-dependent oxidoreductase (luciferase family)
VTLGRRPDGHARGGGISDQCAAPGHEISHGGRHYTVQDARIYTRPEEPVPIYVSGFAPQAAQLAGRVGDGYRLAMPDADLVRAFRAAGHLRVQAGMKVNWDADRDVAAEVAHRPVGHLRAAVGDQRQASNCPANSP